MRQPVPTTFKEPEPVFSQQEEWDKDEPKRTDNTEQPTPTGSTNKTGVHGYTRKDGTHVNGYQRSLPKR
jgi:hypothetical protein